jgi:hypothetical protein
VARTLTGAAAILLLAGCGSSDSKSKGATAAATTPSGTQGAPDVTSASGGGGSGSGDYKLPIESATYTKGRIHIEFGGDASGAAEVDGAGFVINGFANFTFADEARNISIAMAFGGDQGSGAAITYDGLTSGGTFGKECTADFTKTEATALEATFTCTHMPAVSSSSTDEKWMDAHGSIQLTSA